MQSVACTKPGQKLFLLNPLEGISIPKHLFHFPETKVEIFTLKLSLNKPFRKIIIEKNKLPI
jgi:hypothetical protein